MLIYNVDETPLPWPLPQCSRTFKKEEGSRGNEDGESIMRLFSNSL